MMKIALIPLDNRPCNLKYPKEIAASSEIKIITPPELFLGNFLEPGIPKEISSWIKKTAREVDAFIISIDMLAYGGLIASRNLRINPEKALSNLKIIPEIKRLNKSAKIYLFSIITRTSITVDSKVSQIHWKNIFKYLELEGRIKVFNNDADKKEFYSLKKVIPRKLLDKYFAARRRNHQINKEALKFVKNGSADYIILGKEDCSEFGPQKNEVEMLQSSIDKQLLKDKSIILNGADEIASVLAARIYLGLKKVSPKIAVEYSLNPKNKISLYEDEEVGKVVKDHIEAIGARQVSSKDKADLVLFVNMFSKKQKDLFFEDASARTENEIRSLNKFCADIVTTQKAVKKIAIADIAYANGADPEFIGLLIDKIDLSLIHSYAGWNTSGNTIGSALAQAVLPFNKKFLVERFIDDLGYQAIIRRKINNKLEELNISKFNLKHAQKKTEKIVISELAGWSRIFLKKLNILDYDLKITLPWPRTFEIDCDIIIL